MNWRIIVGLALLLIGIKVLYSAIAAGNGAWSGKIGSTIWIGVGLYLLVKGMTKNENKL